ncbi:MAG: hypothetical protein ACKVUS_10995 [Saprospiraceae bacterium]
MMGKCSKAAAFDLSTNITPTAGWRYPTLGANNLYSTGVTIRDSSVLEIKPPISEDFRKDRKYPDFFG